MCAAAAFGQIEEQIAMPLNRFRMPGPLGLDLRHYQKESESEYLDRILTRLRSNESGNARKPVPALSNQRVIELLDRIGGGSQSSAKTMPLEKALSQMFVSAPSKAKGTEGDNPNPPRQPNPFDPALLNAALQAGIRVRLYKNEDPKDKPGNELKLPSTAAAAAGAAAAVVPILPPAGQFPGPVPRGPVNLPGIRPDAFRWPFVEPAPPPATVPGAGGTSAMRFPSPVGVITAGAVVLFFGALIPSDSGIKQIDRTKIGTLLDKLTAIVREEEERLNKETFNGDWSGVAGVNPNLWARIIELKEKDPWTAFKLLKIGFGRTMEERVAFRIIADPDLTDAIDRVGGANQPDFRGDPLGPLEGFTFDITTEEDLEPHLKRRERASYGRYLLVFTYDRWFKESL